ncbi:hypothetical protein EVAR_86044_1 [Eumeta japonica]|uniref:Uncharacterized protein n=1 Tax=Eumeta variegata TaxID=151549 RepID=A0A4C1UJ88_EUMVA|nr:hypothetical protein EVAR_86044_1 [Eumeta japonica]
MVGSRGTCIGSNCGTHPTAPVTPPKSRTCCMFSRTATCPIGSVALEAEIDADREAKLSGDHGRNSKEKDRTRGYASRAAPLSTDLANGRIYRNERLAADGSFVVDVVTTFHLTR